MFTLAKSIAYGLLAVMTAGIIPSATALDFSNSQWIWTNELSGAGSNVPVGHRAFRKDIAAVSGKTPLSANIIITADNGYTLYVNGQQLGTSDGFSQAQSYCTALSSATTVIAVDAVNDGTAAGPNTLNPAGLLVTATITYTDGSTSTFVTDSSWKFSLTLPTNFQQTTFDDSAWPTAVVQGNYGIGPWGTITTPPDLPALSFSGSSWIWTNEGSNSPVGPRVFRSTYIAPSGQQATFANVVISADNEFYLYANGNLVGSEANWGSPQRFVVPINPPSSQVVFAIYAYNSEIGPAGVIAAIEVNTNVFNCAIKTVLTTDESWKTTSNAPNGFQLSGFDDSSWQAATNEGAFGIGPWGTLTLPAA